MELKNWLVAFLIIVAGIYLVGSVTRTITNVQDNKETFIRNSNGKYWEALPANIQAAVDDLGSGGTVWLPTGTFIVTSTPIQLKSNVNLVGMGNSTVLKLGDNQDMDIVVINSASGVLVSDIFFDGNEANQGAYNAYSAIDVKGTAQAPSSHITIKDCTFKKMVASHIDAEEYTSYVTVDSCHFEGRRRWSSPTAGYGGAIWFSGQNNVARNNFIKDTYACGIVLESGTGYPAAQAIIDGNIITGEIAVGIAMEGAGKSTSAVITNNYIYNIGSDAYQPANGSCSGIGLMYGSVASNNIVIGVPKCKDTNGNLKSSYGITASANVTIVNNVVRDIGGYGITRYAGGAPSLLEGNLIENVTASGIYCGGSSDSTVIIGNTIRSADRGIYLLNNRQNCIVSGNIISDMVSYGIIEADTSDYNIITGNNLRSETLITVGAHSIVKDNIV
jgi:parallel beta-helix repeat protein